MRQRVGRRQGRPLALVLACAALCGCPEPDQPHAAAPAAPAAPTTRVSPMPPPPPWVLIPPSRVEALRWPLLTAVAEWPDPEGLRALEEVPPQERPEPAEAETLVSLARSVLRRELLPARPAQALGLDATRRLHLRLRSEGVRGSACAAAHAQGFPTLTVALETGRRAASSIAELRQQVADVLNDDLRAELSRDEHALMPHDGIPAAGLAQLDQETGYGLQFPFFYAYSGRGSLLLVFQELPHEEEGR